MAHRKKQMNKAQKQGHVQKTRKEMRKEQRQLKKAMKNEYFQKKRKLKKKNILEDTENMKEASLSNITPSKRKHKNENREKDKMRKLEAEMQKQRIKQLQNANLHEDKIIRKLEKQLKLNKGKRKKIPKSFTVDGLDYLLEVCEQGNSKLPLIIDQNLNEPDSEFEEDFSLVTENTHKNLMQSSEKQDDSLSEHEDDDANNIVDSEFNIDNEDSENCEYAFEEMSDCESTITNTEQNVSSSELEVKEKSAKHKKKTTKKESKMNSPDSDPNKNDTKSTKNKIIKSKLPATDQSIERTTERKLSKRANKRNNLNDVEELEESYGDESQLPKQMCKSKKHKIAKVDKSVSEDGDNFLNSSDIDEDQLEDAENLMDEGETKKYREDIYGRLRDKEGNVVEVQTTKYVPPHIRANMTEDDSKKQDNSKRLRRQMKGLLNRLAENNMNSIASQVEQLYMSYSRNEVNESLTQLLFESLVAKAITPERLVMEHALLVAVLHANVGSEVGAHVLQSFVKKFQEYYQLEQEIENKELDNIVLTLSHLYNFKTFSSDLMYDILDKLSESFEEKEVELILLILKSVGFTLRKDNPVALKQLILQLQKKAGEIYQLNKSTRVKFMFEILLAIKNNNMIKIPNYDPSHIEHLKKLMKGFLHKGSYVTELKISLDDLLKADERGRWWVIGSAWTGTLPGDKNKKGTDDESSHKNTSAYSQKLLELARKQRMNTDVRRNVFCILMIAEDYLDAFEKLLHLGLKNQQEREIVHVVMHCCLQEKTFNPYYSHLAQKFCDFDRKYQITFQCALWDKFKELQNMSSNQLSNMAKFLVHLVTEKGLPLSVLKVIHFAEVDRITVRFLRQVLLGLLLHESQESVQEVFQRVAVSSKLHIFREGIRLFIHHFLLRNTSSLPEKDKERLQLRAKMADKILSAAESKVMF